ncbi:type VII secretion integral membrane protein EccD [Actinacidiphila guanduensis]|uniref:Type VII secretion integral membrane protein EccD n=1 Tax=Actinacidiphila guanduensis TaxID=310781 RepID=A0A1H0SDG0_9ACTN|nr:type VII secretion integral membrane protein EccD [Actinacidiphila guanduensis]SDP39705.1 type VII secretion integral membrane protein EccD [Actinacidiphila guanduensis]
MANAVPPTAMGDLCRLTVRAPARTVELAVPSDLQLMDVLPSLVGYAGDGLDETGVVHGGWVVQRLGGAPLDEQSTLDALGVRDGETLYLRPRRAALPPVHLDDLVDGLAENLAGRSGTWNADLSRRTLIAALLMFVSAGLGLLCVSGPHQVRVVAAAVSALMLLAGAAAASRAMGDAVVGTALGAAAVPFVALAGALVPPTSAGADMTGPRLLAAGAAAAGTSALALAAVGSSAPLFLASAVADVVLAVEGVMVLALDIPLAHAAALVCMLAVVMAAFVPAVAFRLSGLRLPPLPANADQLQEGIEPYNATEVEARSEAVDAYAKAFYAAVGVLVAVSLTCMLRGFETSTLALMAVVSLLGLLHGGRLGGIWPRLALVAPGLYGAALFTVRLGTALPTSGRLVEFAVVMAVAGCLMVASWTVPGRRLLPHWAHLTNVLHSVAAVSLLPVSLWVFGLYHYARGLGG